MKLWTGFCLCFDSGYQPYVDGLNRVAMSVDPLARLHATIGVWSQQPGPLTARLIPSCRCWRTRTRKCRKPKVLGDAHLARATDGLIKALSDPSLRVRSLRGDSWAKPEAGKPSVLWPCCVKMQTRVILRHAGVMGLVGTADSYTLLAAAESFAVRMAVFALASGFNARVMAVTTALMRTR